MKRSTLSLLLGAIMIVWPLFSSAAQLGVAPRTLTIDAKHPIAEVSISSLRARPVIFDTSIERWEQHGNDDTYAASKSFIIVPSVFALNPYATQLLRVTVRSPASDGREAAYRLSIIEVIAGSATPPPSARAFSIPIFVTPSKVEGDVRYELRTHGDKRCDVVVHNESNTHTYIAAISVASGDQQLYAGKVEAFVLARNTRTIPLTLNAPLRGPATLRIENGAGTARSVSVQASP